MQQISSEEILLNHICLQTKCCRFTACDLDLGESTKIIVHSPKNANRQINVLYRFRNVFKIEKKGSYT